MFNIRVYGVLINEMKQVMLSDEYVRGRLFTKFPGGGMEFGEGTKDCLKRELKEELEIEFEIGEHIYTTDYFQMSAFNPEDQIVSIYYYIKALEPFKVPVHTKKFDFSKEQLEEYEKTKEIESIRFIDLKFFSSQSVTLPIDKIVADIIRQKNKP
ncbi:MAG: NUDIX domain-containing protein [Chitinophagaceae bacterium]|jgi:ADP-ribose pyrophosphatase YjhB (NUDIX family)|nr:NUDIX domain-containing protein [Chitinophagaceae bacterium]OQY92023.1 MAG: NUDIX hydrolase [Sphingobacteriales bacterium UTBCD1]